MGMTMIQDFSDFQWKGILTQGVDNKYTTFTDEQSSTLEREEPITLHLDVSIITLEVN